MSVINIAEKTNELLVALQNALQDAALWSERPPSDHAFASTAPFACDRMAFDQWLQFVFLPQMRMLIEEKRPLPTEIALLPMAEESFSQHTNIHKLLSVLAQIDQVLGGHPVPESGRG